jgi:hypothetical protein
MLNSKDPPSDGSTEKQGSVYPEDAEAFDRLLQRRLDAIRRARDARTLIQMVAVAWSDPETSKYLRFDFLRGLQRNIQRIEDKFRRSFLTLMLLGAGFVLLTHADAQDLTLGFFRVKDFKLVVQICPAVIAYWYYEVNMIDFSRQICYALYFMIMSYSHPHISMQKLHYFLFSSSTLTDDMLSSFQQGTSRKVIRLLSLPIRYLVIVAPIPLEVYAYYWCFKAYGAKSLVNWISLAISLIFVLQVFACKVPCAELIGDVDQP